MHKVALATSESAPKKTNSAGSERVVVGVGCLRTSWLCSHDSGAVSGVYRLDSRLTEHVESSGLYDVCTP